MNYLLCLKTEVCVPCGLALSHLMSYPKFQLQEFLLKHTPYSWESTHDSKLENNSELLFKNQKNCSFMKTEIGCSDHLENKLLSWWIVNLRRKPVRHILYLLLISLWGKRALPLQIASKAEASEGSQDSPAFHMPPLPAESAHVNTPFSSVPRSFLKYPEAYTPLTTPPKKTFPGYHKPKDFTSLMQQMSEFRRSAHRRTLWPRKPAIYHCSSPQLQKN